jgi:hypothetical protein
MRGLGSVVSGWRTAIPPQQIAAVTLLAGEFGNEGIA